MARLWDNAFARWTHTPWQTLIDRNSIGLLVGRKSLDQVTHLSIGSHTNRLIHYGMGREIVLRVCVFFGFFMWVEFFVLYPLVSEICYFYFTLKVLKFWLLPSNFLKISLLPSSFWNSNGRPCGFEIPHNALIVYFWNSLICPFLSFLFFFFFYAQTHT